MVIPVAGPLEAPSTDGAVPALSGLPRSEAETDYDLAQNRNTRQPRAVYDSATGCCWLTSSVMGGTGVQVEQLCLVRFEEDSAYVAATLDPYQVQQDFRQHLGYAVDGDQVTLYIDGQPVAVVTNPNPDMGGFDTDAVWIGEQICYDLTGKQPSVCVTPGIKYITGPVLFYDEMPTFKAEVTMHDGKFDMADITME